MHCPFLPEQAVKCPPVTTLAPVTLNLAVFAVRGDFLQSVCFPWWILSQVVLKT